MPLKADFSVASFAALVLVGCAGGNLKLDSGVAADMQRCGVDIRMSNEFRIQLLNDASDRRLSVATLQELKSTIFDQVPPASRLAVYESYVSCITSRRALASALTDIAARRAALSTKLRDEYNVAEADIGRIEAFYDQEAGQLRNGQIIGARETRARMIYELASIAAKKGITLAIDDIISTGGTPADASGIDAADSDFLNTCLSAADETLCRSMLPVFKDYRSRSNDPNG